LKRFKNQFGTMLDRFEVFINDFLKNLLVLF